MSSEEYVIFKHKCEECGGRIVVKSTSAVEKPAPPGPWKTLRVSHFPTASTAEIIHQIPHSGVGPKFGGRSTLAALSGVLTRTSAWAIRRWRRLLQGPVGDRAVKYSGQREGEVLPQLDRL